jgi:hypothetical protein
MPILKRVASRIAMPRLSVRARDTFSTSAIRQEHISKMELVCKLLIGIAKTPSAEPGANGAASDAAAW